MRVKPLVLVVDDDLEIRRFLRWGLTRLGYDLVEAERGAEGVELARRENPDAILLDVMLPDMTGLEVGAQLTGDPALAEIPILFLSALADLNTKAAGFALGGRDYLTKPVDPREVDMRLKAAIVQRRKCQAMQDRAKWLEAERDRLWREAMIDPLTGFGNRRLLEQRAAALFGGGPSIARHAALLMVDLNGFKRVNDTWGHTAGDHVLKAVAERIRHEMPDADVHVRYGGDEFVVLVDWVEPNSACATGDGLRTALEEMSVEMGDQSIHVSASIGVACYPKDGESIDELIQLADERLYAAKVASTRRRTPQFFRLKA